MIRSARSDDARSITEIYNYYIQHSVITFEEEAVFPEEMAGRIREVLQEFPWLVLEIDDRVAGYAYAARWRKRSAYRFSAESTIYLAPDMTGRGQGSVLYSRLLEDLSTMDIHSVIGGIALPNDASVRLHERLGFRKVAHFPEVGFKFNRWIDVGYWSLGFSQIPRTV